MLPSFLITFREVIEASLIVATVLGILVKLNQQSAIKTVWLAAGMAAIVSILLLGVGSLIGVKVHELFEDNEPYIEGSLMVLSALFITWAVFFLHNYFGLYKTKLLSKIKTTVEKEERRGLFALVFTAVVREGFEIVLFLSTVFFSSNPESICLYSLNDNYCRRSAESCFWHHPENEYNPIIPIRDLCNPHEPEGVWQKRD